MISLKILLLTLAFSVGAKAEIINHRLQNQLIRTYAHNVEVSEDIACTFHISPNHNPKVGKSSYATSVHGEKILNPEPLKHNLNKLAKFQRKFAKTELGSKRRVKHRLKVAKLHGKIKDIRTDFLHKLSTDKVLKYDKIELEDLNVSGMVKNRKLAKVISDLGGGQFRTLSEAKCEKYGREFRVINRWDPTSQKCICCGFKGRKKEI